MFARIVVPGIEMFPGSCLLKGTLQKKTINALSWWIPALFFQTHDICKNTFSTCSFDRFYIIAFLIPFYFLFKLSPFKSECNFTVYVKPA